MSVEGKEVGEQSLFALIVAAPPDKLRAAALMMLGMLTDISASSHLDAVTTTRSRARQVLGEVRRDLEFDPGSARRQP